MTLRSRLDGIPCVLRSPRVWLGSTEIAQSLTLLTELETSLVSSQRALLSRDLARIEQGTAEQVRLLRALAALWGTDRRVSPPADSGTLSEKAEAPELALLRSAQLRVATLARVQAGLLERAARTQKMILHLMAGPERTYETVVSDQANSAKLGEGTGRSMCRA